MSPQELTWRNVSYDNSNFLIAAKYLRLSHPSPGSPLYNLFNAGWIRLIPFGTDYFKLTLVSIIATGATASVLYYYTKNIIAPLIWIASAVVLSQATSAEQYTIIALLSVVAFVLHQKDHRNWAYTILSIGVVVNHLTGFLAVYLLALDYFQKKPLHPFLFMFTALPFLAYIPLVNREPFIFIGGDSPKDYWNYLFSQGGLTGGMAVNPPGDLIRRTFEISMMIISTVGIFAFFIKKVWNIPQARFALIGACVFMVYYWTNLNPQTYTYLVPATALAALAFGFVKYTKVQYLLLIPILLLAIGLNTYSLHVRDHSAAITFYNSLESLPPDSIVWSRNRGWEKTTMELYNYDNGTSINQITLRKPVKPLEEIYQDLILAEQEHRLFKTRVIDPATYHVEIEPATADQVIEDYLQTDMPIAQP